MLGAYWTLHTSPCMFFILKPSFPFLPFLFFFFLQQHFLMIQKQQVRTRRAATTAMAMSAHGGTAEHHGIQIKDIYLEDGLSPRVWRVGMWFCNVNQKVWRKLWHFNEILQIQTCFQQKKNVNCDYMLNWKGKAHYINIIVHPKMKIVDVEEFVSSWFGLTSLAY